MNENGEVQSLIDAAVNASSGRDFDEFERIMPGLYGADWDSASSAVQHYFQSVLRSVFGSNPTYDQLIGVSKGVHKELVKYVNVSPYTVEAVVRSYYGDPQMTSDLPGEAAMMLELAIAGVLLSGPSG